MTDDEKKFKLKKPKAATEFKEFIAKGNILAMAVGIIIGIAFGAVIKSAVDDVIMPPISLALGGADFTDSFIVLKDGTVNGNKTSDFNTLQEAKDAGALTLRWGLFINSLINFLIIALIMFFVVKGAAKLEKEKEAAAPTTKPCPFCDTQIPLKATKCPNCTSKL
jgi:large conductance mechanosensitive channel